MGARLNLAAYRFAEAAQLHDQPTRLLGYMASVALDNDAEPVYYAGAEASARALGKDPATSARLVAKVIATLIKAGAIENRSAGRRGAYAVYRLTFPVADETPESMSATGTQTVESVPLSGTQTEQLGSHSQAPLPEIASHSRAQRVPLTGQQGASDRHPEEEEEKKEEGRVRAHEADAGYTLDTPPEPPPPDSPFCIHHPDGTRDPCYACGQARQAYVAVHGKTPRQPRSPRTASAPQLIQVNGRAVCIDGKHKLTADGRSCVHCQIHEDDLAALTESAIA
ncbi:hypothetical protein RWH43_10645 [Microbacterium sp. KSW2-21]|uniref:Helix-turn-helix domain-containing protein n=1 Tax=Microbacterium algihabitans TaxID=3075992 RepID=A0ABU3RWE9_9MICO|nr:hypothetical protein [Microbacterium sp. KSW2-21]MDU0327212.1 hypothetical protein [Microbacterium sp. KSW2-21]